MAFQDMSALLPAAPAQTPSDTTVSGDAGSANKPSGFVDMSALVRSSGAPATTSVMDYAKAAGAGILEGTGAIAQGGGELLAAGINKISPDAQARAVNLLQPAADWLSNSESQGAKDLASGIAPVGTLADPSTWSFGTNSTLRGAALKGLNVLGTAAPMLVTALVTAGASLPTQLGIGALVGGSQMLGMTVDQERDHIAAMSSEDLDAHSELYHTLVAKGTPPASAKAAVGEAAALGGGIGAAIPAAGQTAFVSAIIGALTRGVFGKLGAGLVAKVLGGTVAGAAEGAAGMTAMTVGQNIGQNIAVGGDTPVMDNTFSAAATGAALGGFTGAAGGVVAHLGDNSPKQQQPILDAPNVDSTIEAFKFDTSGAPQLDTDAIRAAYQDVPDAQHDANQAALETAFSLHPDFTLKNADGSLSLDADSNPVPGDTAYVGDTPLQAIKPQDLPLASAGASGLSRDAYEAISANNEAQGIKNTIVFHDDGTLPDGIVSPQVPGTAFISDNTSFDPVTVAGHETFHLMPQEFKDAVIQIVGADLSDNSDALAAARHNTDPNSPLSPDALAEERAADIYGDAATDPTFQGRVLDAIQERLGPAKAQSYASAFLDSISSLIDKVKAVVTGKTYTTPDGQRLASQYVNNLEDVHAALAAAVADRYVSEGYHSPGADTNASQVLVQRALDHNASQRTNANLPPHLQTVIKSAPPQVPEGASADLTTAVGAALKDPFSRTPEERLAISGVLGGTRMSPKDVAIAQEKAKIEEQRTSPKDVTGTPEFKRWFGDSKITDENGPQVWYHGTARDISTFEPKQAGAIFLTKKPDFAEGFANASESYMTNHADQFFSKADQARMWADATQIAHERGTDIRDEFNGIAADALPSRANIMPVYAKAERPFDYEDPKQVQKLIEVAKAKGVPFDSDDIAGLRAGAWNVLEHPAVQALLKASGHDGFYAAEGGQKNLALYDPAQIKSAIGNTGAFSGANPDIRYSPKASATTDAKRGAHINIGLNVGEKVNAIDHATAERAITDTGAKILRKTYLPAGASEPTLVASLDRALTPEEAHSVSSQLEQQAIAQLDRGRGTTYGPQADQWKFNPDYFQMHNGESLASVQARAYSPMKGAIPDPRTGVPLTRAMRAASLDDYLHGGRLPFAVHTQAELGELLQEMSTSYAPARTNDTPENREFVSRVAEHEARLALSQEGNAVGWYKHVTDNAIKIAALIHPEIGTDPNARFAFTYALAVTSNGATIAENFRNAMRVYASYAEKGKMPNAGFGVRAERMKTAFRTWNERVKEQGVDAFREFMLSKHPVPELRVINSAVRGLVGDSVYGGTIIGPKIGGAFLQNLNGNHDALAMDRWFMRTWGRMTGDLVTSKRGVMETIDSPVSASQRHYIRGTMEQTLTRLQKDYPNLTMSDLQATLWYPEKDLYSMHGVNDESGKPTDYEIEAARYAEEHGIERAAIEQDRGVQPDEPAGRSAADKREGPLGSDSSARGEGARAGDGGGDAGQEPGGRGYALSPKRESEADYGSPRDGAVSVTGIHYSTEPRGVLDSKFYGRGIQGEEGARLRDAGGLRNRTYFYVNEGNGTHPEKGVGEQAHSANLHNMYDTVADPLDLAVKAGNDLNAYEKSVHDAGFDGYYTRGAFGRQGGAVLLGDHALTPQYHGTGYDARGMTPPERGTSSAYRQSQAELAARTDLPAGEMPGDMWQKRLPEVDLSHLDPNRMYYKDEIVKKPQLSPKEPSSKERARALGYDTKHTWYRYDTLDYANIAGAPDGQHLGAIHFAANPKNAEKRFEDIRKNTNPDVGGFTGQYWLRAKNPLLLRDMGTWNPGSVVRQIIHQYMNDPLTHSPAFERAQELADTWEDNFVPEVAAQEEGVDENPATEERIAANRAIISALEDSGYDGIKYRNTFEGGTGIMVFKPSQVRSVNAKFEEGHTGGVLLSPKSKPDWVDSMDTKTQEALRKAGVWATSPTVGERLDAAKDQAGLKTLQATLDQFASVKQKIGLGAYKLLRMAGASDAGLEAAIEYGHIRLNTAGALETIKGTKSFLDILKPLQGESDRFFAWMAGNRAFQLSKEERENLFGAADINALRKLNTRTTPGDAFPGGGDRAAVYAKALTEYNGFNKSILDVAQKSGLINGEQRGIWEKQFYVPFFRESEDGTNKSPGNLSGMVNQYAFKKLTGGEDVLKDLIANTLQNWSHLLSASLKNNAATATLEQGEKLGIATKVADVKEDLKESRGVPEEFSEKNAVYVMKDGKKVGYTVQDPLVLASLSALDATPFQGPVMDALGWFKHVLTVGTTISPIFRLRHTIREQITALAANPTSYNFVKNWMDGFKYSARDNPEYGRALSGGAYFRMGMTLHEQDADYVKRLIAHDIEPGSLVTDQSALTLAVKRGWDWWKETGERSDSITRANLYRQTYASEMAAHKDADRAHFEASYVARDAMDYGLRGTSPSLRMVTQVVPFMNARLQGLYKLGRGAAADPRRFAAVIGGVTLATIGLSLAYRNDKDWQQRSEWDRNNNWWAKIGNVAIRIPKPFEVGALATIVDRALETAMNGFDAESRERFSSNLLALVVSQLSLNPIPQAVFPAVEMWANKNVFTGSQIESMRDEKLSPSERIGPNTSVTAQLLGKANVLSPKQIDFLVSAYFGWIGAHAVATADLALRPAVGLPAVPARRVDDYFLIGDFVKSMPSNQSRFVEQFYNHLLTTQQAFGDMRNFAQTGRGAQASVAAQNPDAQLAPMYLSDSRTISQINKTIRLLQYRTMDPDLKRTQLDQLEQTRNRIAETAEVVRNQRLSR